MAPTQKFGSTRPESEGASENVQPDCATSRLHEQVGSIHHFQALQRAFESRGFGLFPLMDDDFIVAIGAHHAVVRGFAAAEAFLRRVGGARSGSTVGGA